jgi:hypothetical protein
MTCISSRSRQLSSLIAHQRKKGKKTEEGRKRTLICVNSLIPSNPLNLPCPEFFHPP